MHHHPLLLFMIIIYLLLLFVIINDHRLLAVVDAFHNNNILIPPPPPPPSTTTTKFHYYYHHHNLIIKPSTTTKPLVRTSTSSTTSSTSTTSIYMMMMDYDDNNENNTTTTSSSSTTTNFNINNTEENSNNNNNNIVVVSSMDNNNNKKFFLLEEIIKSLQEKENDDDALKLVVSSSSSSSSNLSSTTTTTTATHINSIILKFVNDDINDNIDDNIDDERHYNYVLAILKSDDRIDMRKIQKIIVENNENDNENDNENKNDDSIIILDDNDTTTTTNNNNNNNNNIGQQRQNIIDLVPSELVSKYCGYQPGTIPPIGLLYPKQPSLIIIEESLMMIEEEGKRNNENETNTNTNTFIGGGGMLGRQLHIKSISTILKYYYQSSTSTTSNNVIVGSFRQQQQQPKTNDDEQGGELKKMNKIPRSQTSKLEEEEEMNSQETNNMNNNNNNMEQQQQQQQLPFLIHDQQVLKKPYFDVAPPDIELAKKVALMGEETGDDEAEASSSLFEPTWVTLVGRISGVRKMAKTLVFCDFAPLVGPLPTPQSHPWRNPLTGDDMAIQLICGKTYCQRRSSNDDGVQGLRNLKVGQMILLQGKTNVANRESLKHWITKNSLDIILWDYQLLYDNAHAAFHFDSTTTSSSSSSSSSITPLMGSNTLEQQQQKSKKKKKQPVIQPYSHYPILTLIDIGYGSSSRGNNNSDDDDEEEEDDQQQQQQRVFIVNTMENIETFAKSLSKLEDMVLPSPPSGDDDDADNYSSSSSSEVDNNDLRRKLVGVDCEWKPSFLLENRVEPQPVLVLQISLHAVRQVFIFDLQSLLRPLLQPPVKEDDDETTSMMNNLESSFSIVMQSLLTSKDLVKVGFHLDQDLRRLASSYPHIPAFHMMHSVLEVSLVAKKSMHIHKQKNVRVVTGSLNRLCCYFLQYQMDKTQQISDWSTRPFTKEQIDYAALDAAVTPTIVSKILDDTSMKFFPQSKSWRFLFFEGQTTPSNALKRLGAKKCDVGNKDLFIADQRWYTEEEATEPRLPSIPDDNDSTFVDGAGRLRIPSTSITLNGTHMNDLLETSIGTRVAKTKDQCVDLFLNDDIPPDGKVDFHIRSGYVEFANAVFLFVNMPRAIGRKVKNYNNKWLDDGRILTWYFKERDWQNGTSNLGKKLLFQGESSSSSSPSTPSNRLDDNKNECPKTATPNVLLFVRLGTKKFISCGRCQVKAVPSLKKNDDNDSTPPEWWELTELHLVLQDWEKLQQSKDFLSLVYPPSPDDVSAVSSSSDSSDGGSGKS